MSERDFEQNKKQGPEDGLSDDHDQLDIIEEQIFKKISAIKDLKQLNKVQQFTDDQIFNGNISEMLGDSKDGEQDNEETNGTEDGAEEDDDDDDSYFECDIERYVSFEDKLEFAERLKGSTKEQITQIIKLMGELQPQALDDYGNSRVQLKIDMIEKDAFLKCKEIMD